MGQPKTPIQHAATDRLENIVIGKSRFRAHRSRLFPAESKRLFIGDRPDEQEFGWDQEVEREDPDTAAVRLWLKEARHTLNTDEQTRHPIEMKDDPIGRWLKRAISELGAAF